MGLTFIAFEGYEVIVQSGEEVKNPKRNIPRAIFISLDVVANMYCLVAFVSIGAILPDMGPAWQFMGQNGDLGISKAAELFMPYGERQGRKNAHTGRACVNSHVNTLMLSPCKLIMLVFHECFLL